MAPTQRKPVTAASKRPPNDVSLHRPAVYRRAGPCECIRGDQVHRALPDQTEAVSPPRIGRKRYYEGAMSPQISIDREAVSAFCRRYHIGRLALFGSVLRDDFGPHSDIDVLVEFQPGHVPGLDFVAIERVLAAAKRPARRYGYAKVPQRTNSRSSFEKRRTSVREQDLVAKVMKRCVRILPVFSWPARVC